MLLASSNSFPLPEDHLAIQHFYTVCLAGSLLPFPAMGVFHTGLCKVPLLWVLGIGASAGRNLLVSGLS